MAILLVNFGGPRDLDEIEPFLCELLCDRELIYTPFPDFIHNFLFRRAAKKRAPKIRPDYAMIGGKSPIYETTEEMAAHLREAMPHRPILTFHRYLPTTHTESLQAIEECAAETIDVFPFFPQFSYVTTGSIAMLLAKRLSPKTISKLRWVASYPTHPAFVLAWQSKISLFLKEHSLKEEETILFFSAHGLPKSFIEKGDPYEQECKASYDAILSAFPQALGKLAYQSKFGRGEWLRPYTDEACNQVLDWNEKRKTVVFIPLAFTSDHIETLYEIETLYLPIIRAKGLAALRCPALNLDPLWQEAILEILQKSDLCPTGTLLRK